MDDQGARKFLRPSTGTASVLLAFKHQPKRPRVFAAASWSELLSLVVWPIAHTGATFAPYLWLPRTQIRAYRWCSPPRIGCAMMSPNRSIGRVQGVSLPSERWVRTSL